MKRLFFFLFLSNACLAQNGFIANPGFEPIPKELSKEYSLEQQVLRRFNRGCNTCLHDWTALLGFADMNNAFIEYPSNDPPKKYFGESFGSLTFYSSASDINELKSGYFETKLKKPLLQGHKYEVSFQIALSHNLSNYSTNKMGIYFSGHEIKLDTVLPVIPQIEVYDVVDTSGEYTLFKDTVIATGYYTYLTMGYFPKGIPLKKIYRRANLDNFDIDRKEYDSEITARYCIDEIAIREIANTVALEAEIRSKINLRNIQFETGSAILLESGKPELIKLVTWLQENKAAHLRIEGHTDDMGEAEAHQSLSENRAKSIVQFLVNQGIEKGRLEAMGFGESKPIAPNSSNENRALNRRVEIKILE